MKNILQFLKSKLASKDSFYGLIIIILLCLIISMKMCNRNSETPAKPTITVKRDTVYKVHDSIIPKYIPKLVKVEVASKEKIDSIFTPAADYIALKNQYEGLAANYTDVKTYDDTVKIDSIGYINISDKVQNNSLIDRQVKSHYRIPTITTTITINNPPKQVNQLYIGGGLIGSPSQFINGIDAGLMLKTKKDDLYGAEAGVIIGGSYYIGLHYYKKISFGHK